MSRKLLAFLLSELNTVRIICQNEQCHAVIEMRLEDLATKDIFKCLFCDQDFNPLHAGTAPLKTFAAAVAEFRALQYNVDLEFVLPEKE